MPLLTLSNLSLAIGDLLLLDEASLSLEPGEHVALVGRNGCGKSSLLRKLSGLETAAVDIVAGQIQIQRGATVGYLAQDPELDANRTLRQEAGAAFAELDRLHAELQQVAHDMADAEGDALQRIMQRYERVEQQIHAAGGFAVDHQIDATLHGLGLTDDLFEVKVADLSGGQRGRLALAKLLLTGPDLLMLDEPTNHLDIAGREWLEQFLAGYRGAVILVSHDRWLLDRVATKIVEMELADLVEYPGNYTKFRELRAERRLAQQRAFDKQKDKFRREQQFIDRYRAGQRAKQAKGREKRLERNIRDDQLERPVELDDLSIRLAPMTRSGDLVITADGLTKGYDGRTLFHDVTLVIRRGDRVGLIGPNGAGKSTLARCLIAEQEADRGRTRVGSQVEVGWYRQTHEHLPRDVSIVDYLRRSVTGCTEQAARDLAGAFLFTGGEQEKVLGDLSGGERSRVALAGLLARGHNLLVLDEPTNHLDIPSVERLEEILRRFGDEGKGGVAGTLLLITHDRMLLNDLVDQLLIFDGHGGVKHFLGTYADYEAAQRTLAIPAATPAPTSPPQRPAPTPAPKKGAGSALSKLSQQALEQRIIAVESRLAEIDQVLANPATYRDGDKIKKLQAQRDEQRAALTPLEAEWATRAR